MARFDIGPATARMTGLETKMRNDGIRKEFEPMIRPEQSRQVMAEPSVDPSSTKLASEYTAPQAQYGESIDPLLPAAIQTVNLEARRDKAGNIAVYKLPSGDMGGTYEVAGINDRYHPGEARRLASLPPEQRELEAARYIRKYTAPIVDKMPDQMKAFVQDMAFNRGAGGATRYLQQGLNDLGVRVSVDGRLGPQTLGAIQSVQPRALMQAASNAQLQDEYSRAQANPDRRKFLQGLENRIRNRFSLFGTAG